jgi:spore germination protein
MTCLRQTALLLSIFCFAACSGSSSKGFSANSSPSNTATTGASTGTSTGTGTATPAMPSMAPRMKVSGWLPTWTGQRGKDSVVDNTGASMDEVNPFWFSLKSDGRITAASGARDATLMAAIRAAGGELLPTIHDVSDKTATQPCLTNATARAALVQNILSEVDAQDYDGIDIDFEHVTSSFKADFHTFLASLRDGLHQRGKILSIAIPGKRNDGPSWAGYDYSAVGPLVDRFKIMTYGYSGPWSSQAGPIAPVTWISRVLDYAVTKVAREKIYIGIPFYGYDWPADGSTVKSVTWSSAQPLLALSTTGMSFDTTLGETRFEYTKNGVNHTVYFQDDRAIAAKCALVDRYQVAGIAIWALGYGDTSFWAAIDGARMPIMNNP